MNKEIYEMFARVLVKVGANLQQGETAIIQAEPKHWELVREITAACYQNGARFVKTEYYDDMLSQIRAKESREEYLCYYPAWLYEYQKQYGADNICVITLRSPVVAEIEDRNIRGVLEVRQSQLACGAGFAEAMAGGSVSYVKTVVPSKEWAVFLYPQLTEEEALDKLWKQFLPVCRLDQEDPIAAWRRHQEQIRQIKNTLDELELQTLYLQSANTQLEVGLVKGGHWLGGCAVNQKNQTVYVPNIPTEEIFFVPDKYRVNGRVTSTLPLNYKGNLIEGMALEIRNGKVVEYKAERGGEWLASIVNTDEGSCYFGEISLVTVRSPIYQTHTVYYETLLDENAACHMALGNGTSGILERGYELTVKEREAMGINNSGIHVDFMIGSPDLDVDGVTKSGQRWAILRQGEWAIERT